MDILTLLEEIRTVARNGLTYAQNPYDRERYTRLLDVAVQTYSQTLDLPSAEVRARLTAELGYTTPKVGGDAAVFDEEGRVLLVQRADDRTWCLPCGWVDPNESPRDCAVREAREETGLLVRPLRLVDVFSLPAGAGNHVHGLVAVVYLCEAVGGALRVSHESLDVRYWHIADVPAWHPQHRERAAAAYRLWHEENIRNA
ncbi:MAG TPA: NUDIX hydrolase N-terminal domain-containing protein [Roseiflexaceae bacterium]|nr:NUDIX hydrolase N-terminal domain-containing protein [Roseiflexaceae bacterium]